MTDLFKETRQKVCDGARFSINFENRSMKINGKYVIKDGKAECEIPSIVKDIAELTKFYDRFYNSVPSERSDNKRKTYFRALSEKDLSDDDMMYGERRETAQFELEYALLSAIINEDLKWEHFQNDNPKANWFWQSTSHPSFVIFKKWITNN